MMNKSLFAARSLLTIVLLISCSGRCPDEPGVYCDKANGFYVTFPVDWTVEADPGDGIAVRAAAPLEPDMDPAVYATSFEVIVFRMPGNRDLDTFFETRMKKLPEGKPYYQLEDSGEIKTGGRKTKYILYVTDTEPRYEARLEYIQEKGGAIYIFRGVTRGARFHVFHDRFREIAYTFRLT